MYFSSSRLLPTRRLSLSRLREYLSPPLQRSQPSFDGAHRVARFHLRLLLGVSRRAPVEREALRRRGRSIEPDPRPEPVVVGVFFPRRSRRGPSLERRRFESLRRAAHPRRRQRVQLRRAAPPPIPRAFFSSRYFSSSSSASSSPSTWTCPRFSSRERTDPRRRATRGNRQPRDAPPSSPNVRESTRPRAKKRRDRTRRRRRRRRRDSRGESVGARLGMRWRRRPRTSRDRAAYGVDASSKTSPAPSSSFGGRGSSPRKIRSPPPLSPPRALFSPSSIRVQSRRGTRRRRPRRRRPPPRRRAPSPPA